MIPKEYAQQFKVNGQLLPGYTIEGEEVQKAPEAAVTPKPEVSAPVQPETVAEAPALKPVIPLVISAKDPAGRMKEITDKLEDGIRGIFDSERYAEYLRAMSKFHNYSFNNTILIAMQGGTLVKGYSQWEKEFERHVKPGEKGIKIIAPAPFKVKQEVKKLDPTTQQPVIGADGKPVMEEKEVTIPSYKVVTVFDVSQTEGKELPKEGLELRGFSFSIKKKDLLHVENLTIPKGAVVAVLGNNGAGKTTLARCLCGLERKMRGTFAFMGQEYTPKQRLKLCYMVMQDVNHQLFAESVLDEVTLGIKDIEEEEKTEYAKNILSMLDLLAHEDKHPMSLSGGQKQRVAIAGAIASHKEIIVYDEPTSGLDYRHMKEVSACIQKLSEMGKTQMIITHDPELVAHCCDYMVFMDNGAVSRFGEWTDENIEFASCYFENPFP